MDQESLAQIQQIVGTVTEALRADIAGVKRHTDVATEALRIDVGELKRRNGVLVEDLRREVELVTEGYQMHLDRRHAEDREHLDYQFRETRALIQLSYSQLHERVERLEQRVRTIEQHLGLPI